MRRWLLLAVFCTCAVAQSPDDQRDFACMHANAVAIEHDTQVGLCLIRWERMPFWKRALRYHFHNPCGGR